MPGPRTCSPDPSGFRNPCPPRRRTHDPTRLRDPELKSRWARSPIHLESSPCPEAFPLISIYPTFRGPVNEIQPDSRLHYSVLLRRILAPLIVLIKAKCSPDPITAVRCGKMEMIRESWYGTGLPINRIDERLQRAPERMKGKISEIYLAYWRSAEIYRDAYTCLHTPAHTG